MEDWKKFGKYNIKCTNEGELYWETKDFFKRDIIISQLREFEMNKDLKVFTSINEKRTTEPNIRNMKYSELIDNIFGKESGLKEALDKKGFFITHVSEEALNNMKSIFNKQDIGWE